MDEPYAYVLGQLKKLLGKDRRQLFLKDSRAVGYLGDVKPDQMCDMRWGEFPAIEALALAVTSLRDDEAQGLLREEYSFVILVLVIQSALINFLVFVLHFVMMFKELF